MKWKSIAMRIYSRFGIYVLSIIIVAVTLYIWTYPGHKSNSLFDVTWETTGKSRKIEFIVRYHDNAPLTRQSVWCTNDTDSMGGLTNDEGYLEVTAEGEGKIWMLELKDKGSVEWYLFHPSSDNGLLFDIRMKK